VIRTLLARIARPTLPPLLAVCLLLAGPPSPAQDSGLDVPVGSTGAEGESDDGTARPALEELDPVFIYGGAAAPRMWKVSRDGNVMWVAVNRAAPAGSTWRLDGIESRLAESKLALFPGTAQANPDIGIFRALTLIRSAFKAGKNPDGKTLKDVLPPETYARWLALKTTYVGRDNDIEEWRPSIALAKLEEKIGEKLRPKRAARRARPPAGPMLQPLVEKAARKLRVKTRTMPKVEKKVEIENLRSKLKSTHKLNLVDEKCVADYLTFLEQQVDYLKRQAGGVEELAAPDRPAECNEGNLYIRKVRSGEIPDSVGFVELISHVEQQTKLAQEELDTAWIEAAQAALAKNSSTIAVLNPINTTGARSYIDQLRALGYTVEEPAAEAN
jgi:hypothetical protein